MAGYHGHAEPGAQYDRYLAHNEQSTLHKFKETYWTTKQAVIKKLGKKEDEHVVASDAQLDAKLEVFKAIQTSCMDLLRALEKYQDKLCTLSQEENGMGRFLKTMSQQDRTRAGKMMAAVGKSQSFSSQQRLALRVPLVRLYQEVETFRYRAISDTLMTINRMESARTEYRGALLWMKDISEEMDPDSYKQLEKFRKVQAQVKKTKARFDKLKLDTMQKIDLLAASRCNMFSHVLANYQTTLLHFWDKTSRTMTAVSESFKGYQYYEFNMLKELCEPTKKLAEETGYREEAEKEEDAKDGLTSDDPFGALPPSDPHRPDLDLVSSQGQGSNLLDSSDDLLSSSVSQPQQPPVLPPPPQPPALLPLGPKPPTLQPLSSQPAITNGTQPVAPPGGLNSDLMELINFGEEEKKSSEPGQQKDEGSMTNLLEEIDKEMERPAKKPGTEANDFLDFGDDEKTIDEIKKAQDQKFDLNRLSRNNTKDGKKTKAKAAAPQANKDLLSDDLDTDDLEKDDMTLLNEILNAPSTGEDEFSREWTAVFGTTPLSTNTQFTPVETDQSQSDFMPSSLLDISAPMGAMSLGPQGQGMGAAAGMGAMGMQQPAQQQQMMMQQQQQPQQQQQKPKPKKGQKADMSAWFNLFADLDPLANPDAIGKRPEDITDA